MTSRLLLTLLALLTGFSAQGTAVQARAVTGTTQVAAVSALATVQSARAAAVRTRPSANGGVTRTGFDAVEVRTLSAARAPTVLPQVDRAHE